MPAVLRYIHIFTQGSFEATKDVITSPQQAEEKSVIFADLRVKCQNKRNYTFYFRLFYWLIFYFWVVNYELIPEHSKCTTKRD